MNRITLLLYCILCANSAHAEAVDMPDDLFPTSIWVNEVDRKSEVLLLTENNKFYIECADLDKLQIKVEILKRHATKNSFCLVTDQDIQSGFDPQLQAIKINLPSKYFFGLETDALISQPMPANFGAFLNYEMHFENNTQHNNFGVLPELGVFKDNWILRNNAFYRNNKGDDYREEKFVRLNSSLEFDFSKSATKLIIGDTTSAYSALIHGVRFGGLSFGTDYTSRPDFVYWNIPSLKGSAVLPSTVDLYIDGVNIYQKKISPGDYNLQTGANIESAGTAQMVVQDVLGNTTVRSFPVLISSKLLKEDLNDYNISLGKLRFSYDEENSDYRDFFSSAYWRRGVTSRTTLGASATYSDKVKNAGLLWTQAVNRWFVLDSIFLGSKTDNDDGYSAGLAISRNFGKLNFGVSSRYATNDYRALGYEDNHIFPKFENMAYLSFANFPFFQNLNLNYIEQTQYESNDPLFELEDRKMLTVGVSREITPNLMYTANYFQEFGDSDDSGAFITFSYNFGGGKRIQADAGTNKSGGVRFIQNAFGEYGANYALGVDYRNDETVLNAYGGLSTNVGDLTLSHLYSENDSTTQVGYRGAMVWLGGQYALTSFVDNAFALVNVGGREDIDVMRSMSPVAKTNKKGYAFVHDIVPYINYDISFDENQLPIESKVPNAAHRLVALRQRGYNINFSVFDTQQILVKILDEQGHQFVAGSEVAIDTPEADVYPVGSDGTVMLYGLVEGYYKLTVRTSGGRSCQTALTVPKKVENQTPELITLQCK
ncbi:fimbria/pilus outer membrane usher protein [Avibacterium paragallinarum]